MSLCRRERERQGEREREGQREERGERAGGGGRKRDGCNLKTPSSKETGATD